MKNYKKYYNKPILFSLLIGQKMQNTFQNSFMSLWFTFKKQIRAKEFLKQMDKVIPYERFLVIIWEKYGTW